MIGIVLFSICVGLFLLHTMRRPKNFLPGPPMFPIVGNLLQIKISSPNQCISRMHKKYGDFGMVVPYYNMVFLKTPKLIREFMTSDSFNSRPDVIYNRDRFNGKNLGILFIGGQLLEVNKKLALHSLRNLGMGRKRQEFIITNETEKLIKRIDSFEQKPFEIEKLIFNANMNTTWTILGGRNFSEDDPQLYILGSAISGLMRQFGILGGFTLFFPWLRHLFPYQTGHTEYMKNNKIISDFIVEAVEYHKRTRERDNPRDFIDSYLDEIDRGDDESHKVIHEDQLRAVCYDAIIGGSDTTSTTLTFTILLLAVNPTIQQKLYEEIVEVIGTIHMPTSEDQLRMPYCKAIINEVLRYRPTIPIAMAHEATREAKIGPYDVPKGTVVLANLEELFFDKEIWGDPGTFRPERFLTENAAPEILDAALPFGKGKRKCMGESQARLTTFIVMTSLIQKFTFQLPEGKQSISTEGSYAFLLSAPKFEIIAIPRNVSKFIELDKLPDRPTRTL